MNSLIHLNAALNYNFTRMFSFLAGVTLSEYIRRRRLTLAAFDLQDPRVKVIDVAIKYSYNSADSFSRAFSDDERMSPWLRCAGGSCYHMGCIRVRWSVSRNTPANMGPHLRPVVSHVQL